MARTWEKVSDQILQDAHLDQTLRIRLAGIPDLRSKGRYHLRCLTSFTRSSTRSKKTSHDSWHRPLYTAPYWWTSRCCRQRTRTSVLKDVWQRYVKLASESSTEIPQCFLTWFATFNNKLKSQKNCCISKTNGNGDFNCPISFDQTCFYWRPF